MRNAKTTIYPEVARQFFHLQGSFLSLNSTPETIGRNAGIFYVMLKSSGLIGNTFSYFQFKDSYEIAPDTLTLFVSVLVVVSAMGTLTVTFVFPTKPPKDAKTATPAESLVGAAKLMLTREMRYLLIYFTYTGLVFTFWSGVYGPCLSFSRSFGADGNSLTSLHGIAAHAGEISMGTFLAVFSGVAKRFGRYSLVTFGLIAHMTAFALISINVPADAPLGVTYDDAALIVPSNTGLALFCSYLLGVGVMCLESQTVSLVGVLYSGRTSQAFAVVKVFQHGAVGVAYAYSGYANLYVQLGILAAFGVLGGCAFAKIELECFGTDFDVPRRRDSITVVDDSIIKD